MAHIKKLAPCFHMENGQTTPTPPPAPPEPSYRFSTPPSPTNQNPDPPSASDTPLRRLISFAHTRGSRSCLFCDHIREKSPRIPGRAILKAPLHRPAGGAEGRAGGTTPYTQRAYPDGERAVFVKSSGHPWFVPLVTDARTGSRAAPQLGVASERAPGFIVISQMGELLMVVVAGEFNAGKSTFISALLGDE